VRAGNDWCIRQVIDIADPQQANAAARETIASGAESICFECMPVGSALRGVAVQDSEDMRLLVAGLPRGVPLSFRAGQAARPLMLLYLSELKQPAEARGSVDFDPLGDLLLDGGSARSVEELLADAAALMRFVASSAPRLRTLAVRGWQIPEAGGTVVQELVFALAGGVEYLCRLGGHALSVDEVCARLFFVFSAGTNYFFEIAKLRAFRLLWAQAVEQFQPERSESLSPVVESVTSRWPMTTYDAYGNLLRGATAAMSAAIGGCDTIEITPFDAPYQPSDGFSRRLSRNTQIMLKKESYLDHVADPGAGSYYIETLTASLAREAWKLFQQVEAEGGFLKAIESGQLQREVNAARKRKDDAVVSRRRILLGTNQYPNASEQAADKLHREDNLTPLRLSGRKPASTPSAVAELQFASGLTLGDCLQPQQAQAQRSSGASPAAQSGLAFTVEKLIAYRAAEGFEALRLRTDRHAQATGRRPRVLLLEFGDAKMRQARAVFSQNFFAMAGFEVVNECIDADAELAAKAVAGQNPDLVVLCSADQQYPGMARPLIEKLRGAKPVPVIVAGYPEEAVEQLKQDGVADFIHLRSNALLVLAHWQQQLGLRD
jgi:methylmalonyl-CoA mutase